MLIFYLVISCCAVIFCSIGVVASIRDGNWGEAIFVFFLGVLLSILLFAVIDSIRKDNTQTVEYYFPADHYTFEQIITETNETKYAGADTLVVLTYSHDYRGVLFY